ncbi:WD repeat-containing protein 76 [Nymphon striatum]|nr:WD repeat-containing protein 76 [Nymphon striatum]KAG1681642.1 WD repeat-containing protein 76 [Nymphon striatum]
MVDIDTSFGPIQVQMMSLSSYLGKISSSNSEMKLENDAETYENMRQKNIEEKRKLLELMKFQEIKEDIHQLTAKKKQPRRNKRNWDARRIKLELRPKSLRLQGINPDLIDTSTVINTFELDIEERFAVPIGPLNFDKALRDGDDIQLSEHFISQLKSASYDRKIGEDWSNPVLSKVKNKFKSLQLQEKNVAKVVPSRIFSIEVHPSINKLLVFAGDKTGHLGIWDVHAHNTQDGVNVYRPHSRPVNCLKFNKENPHYLYSLGYDQTIRQADLTKAVFEEIFRIPDDENYSCSYFDFLSSNSAVVSLTNGMVALTDFRDKSVTNYEISSARKYALKTISVHPTKKQYFITNGTEGTITLWDSRHMKVRNGKPIASLPGFKTTSSAFFSPITGNKILATSYNDTISHNNRTGRWLTPLKAAWLPNNEDLFVVGSMDRPRRIEILSETGQAFHLFSSDYLASVCSTNSIHPAYNILAGGNSSGRVHLFM